MAVIWYLLKCPEGNEADYARKYEKLAVSREQREVICFEYQRMMRYGGKWHMERRPILPGWLYLLETNSPSKDSSVIPCEEPYLKSLCQEDHVVGMSRGVIKNGVTVVTSGPLKGRETLIRRIDRHKRTAEIESPFGGRSTKVTVGLEIYEKQC